MKKIFIIIVASLFIFPVCLRAEIKGLDLEEALKSEGIEPTFDELIRDKKQVTINFFRNKGEEKSVEFLKFLNDNYEEYGVFFNLVSYEVTESQDNKELMDNVKDYLSAQVSNAPFIVIGNTYITTYNESVNDNVIGTVLSYYDSQDKTDKVDEVLVRYYRNENLIICITFLIIVGIAILVVYASRKNK